MTSSTTVVGISNDACIDQEALPQKSMENIPLRSLLTPSIVLPIVNYALLAFLDIALVTLLPLFFSTPTYLGGLGFTPSTIGSWLATFAVINGSLQALLFARIVNWLGPKRLFCFSVSCFTPVMIAFPVLSWLVHTRGNSDFAITLTLLGQLAAIVIWSLAYSAYYDRNLLEIGSNSLAKAVSSCLSRPPPLQRVFLALLMVLAKLLRRQPVPLGPP